MIVQIVKPQRRSTLSLLVCQPGQEKYALIVCSRKLRLRLYWLRWICLSVHRPCQDTTQSALTAHQRRDELTRTRESFNCCRSTGRLVHQTYRHGKSAP